jgi:hypothetical protein
VRLDKSPRFDKSESSILELGHKLYKTSLIFYPTDLRGEFGNEMIQVFDEQAWESYSQRGLPGLLRVWLSASREIITVAFPGHLFGRAIPILGVTATLAFMLWFGSYINSVMETACSCCGFH